MKIPVLLYHTVSDPSQSRLYPGICVPPRRFAAQMNILHKNGFKTIGTGSLAAYLSGGAVADMPERPIMITFDDGYSDNLTEALPEMEKYGFKSVIYTVASSIGGENSWDVALGEHPKRMMGRDELLRCIELGHEIGGHTLNHAHLAALGKKEAACEIAEGNRVLEEMLGIRIENFAYPYGEYDDKTIDIIKDSGLLCAVTTDFGTNTSGTDPFLVRRIPVRSNTHILKFISRISRFSEKRMILP